MLRFRNPKTDPNGQIDVLRALYKGIEPHQTFDLDDMRRVIAQTSLVTAYGFAGAKAATASTNVDKSRDSLYNNMKMHAEIFKLYGWIVPASPGKSYPVRFTLVGACAANSPSEGAMRLMKEAVLGYVNPSETLERVVAKERVRFFPLVLRTFVDLGGRLTKGEFVLGPMSTDDSTEDDYQRMLDRISKIRGSKARHDAAFTALANELKLQSNSVFNNTRLPIALLRQCGWIERSMVPDAELYDERVQVLAISDAGREQASQLEELVDVRLEDYRSASVDEQRALCRLGVYQQLKRTGFDVSSVSEQIEQDRDLLAIRLRGGELLFSPYQTVFADEVDEALGIDHDAFAGGSSVGAFAENLIDIDAQRISSIDLVVSLTNPLTTEVGVAAQVGVRESERYLREHISGLSRQGLSISEIVEKMFIEHRKDKEREFYPLVADLFTMAGVYCRESPSGNNGLRWDAIISDPEASIPIEIKSPTEEAHLSMKAVRQAIENKVVLLSRETEKTRYDTTTLAVGYNLPNDRADVRELILYAEEAFGFRVAIVGLKELLVVAIKAVVRGEFLDPANVRELKGIVNVEV